ncbi:MAG TPA: UvrD-helicase domain-containing protein [Bryobacteraceae bacterium]|nr:UvrD-helicase domain-containing protein [Bryobacteraceae bacterium]
MSSPVILHQLDEPQRQTALDPTRSFTVRAPAGSGKTELLIQRFLRLLAVVTKPESIVAITFTRKAAGEMLDRVLGALHAAKAGTPVEKPHMQTTRELALAVLQRDRELAWDLLDHPGRLRVQTIDSLCMSITGEMPWLARLGGMPRIEEDARQLYEEAAHLTLLDSTPDYQQALTTLLRHLDNNSTHARELIASMLATRDQWMKLAVDDDENQARAGLERALADTVVSGLAAVNDLVTEDLRGTWLDLARFAYQANFAKWPGVAIEDVTVWRTLVDLVLTGGDDWRKRKGLNVKCGFPPGSDVQKNQCADLIAVLDQREGLLEALKRLRRLPPPVCANEQWEVLRALLRSLKLAVAQLKMVFRQERVIDFMELGIAAREALGHIDNPTEVAYRMDSRIEHLLVDEFQDTSRAQFELLLQLTGGWQPDDGRTLFLVGDPMQSIYRFRQAEVGLFHAVENKGIGGLRLHPLQLHLNRRSGPAIVKRVNALFADRFPKVVDDQTGAVTYTDSQAAQTEYDGVITVDGFVEGEDQLEAACVIRRIREAQHEDPGGSIAILVRARSHLFAITAALKTAALPFSAVDIDSLAERSVVRDLLALTRALLNPADRVAWLSILRAPWCGLTLADLEALLHDRTSAGVWECLQDLRALSDDGHKRAASLRDMLQEAFAEQGRWPLRRWLERVWMKLGGPACLDTESSLRDAAAYFDLLEASQAGADLRDLDRFENRVTELFAQPENPAGPGLHVMTIHKAKGLEFDTVILPGLGRRSKPEDKPLVLFHEWRQEDHFECLMAPIDETRAEPDALYSYLRDIERQKDKWERARQLYVATTRAKKRLHLMGHVRLDKTGEPKPASDSMLADLWPALTPEEVNRFRRTLAAVPAPTQPPQPMLRRLPDSWRLPELPAPVEWHSTAAPYAEPHEPSFEWVGESLRHAGTVVHAFLQRMPDIDADPPDLAVLKRALTHAGVSPLDLESTAQRVRQALARIRTSRRGRWILAPHKDSHTEYAVTGVVNGEVVRGLVDRTFVDEGIRWIIDFKTSAHEGGNLPAFLDEQQRRYSDQLQRYASILAALGNPVKVGLYFPLLDEWREWSPAAT